MKRKRMIEINGARFMIPSVAASLWDISSQAVTRACSDGRIVGACKDTTGKWIIPADTKKPLEIDTIRNLLIGILRLKNEAQQLSRSTEYNRFLQVLQYLADIGCIELLSKHNDDVITGLKLTEKGFRIATEGKRSGLNWINTGSTMIQLVASVITIWQAVTV